MKKILITSRSFSTGILNLEEKLKESNFQIVRKDSKHNIEDLALILPHVSGWIAGTGPITQQHLELARDLRIIARYGVGFDAVDLISAKAHGITVTNTPGVNSRAVAEHSLALLLALLRNVVSGDRGVRSGLWEVAPGKELGSLRILIIGFGKVGREVAKIFISLGSVVMAYDPFVEDAILLGLGVTPASTNAQAMADVVFLMLPGGEVVVDAKWISKAQRGLILINTARANLIDNRAVIEALQSGVLAGYATDTLSSETSTGIHGLLSNEFENRIVLTPHTAAQTVEAIDAMGLSSYNSINDFFQGRSPTHMVVDGTKIE
jgi:D-3-phosphoglycerate dehydrogenase